MLYKILKVIIKPLFKVIFNYKVINKPQKAELNRIILVANHKSLLDPIFLAIIYDRPVRFMAKKELFKNKLFAKILDNLGVFPVDRKNNDMNSMRKAMDILNNDEVLGIFPEGTRVKDEEISVDMVHQGVSLIAAKTNSDIIPIEIRGKYGFLSGIQFIFKEKIKLENLDKSNRKNYYTKIQHEVFEKLYIN